ncbi:RNA polymerase sigma factor [Streptomyces sp. NPDC048279]|uniref:RNA polymerase sigma factor n=1 Tax=Streptomyces sp. NPDC048279 TaxID=3154714 RepID=UPI00342A6C12
MSGTRSDGELLRAIAADSDRRAFEEPYRRYAPWLTARLRGRCADPAVVDDVAQETFLAVWRGTARYHAESDAAGWLWRIGSRRLVDALRGDGARGRLRHRDEASAEERVLAGVEHGDLAGALVRFSPELRAVLQATVIDGLTTRGRRSCSAGRPAGRGWSAGCGPRRAARRPRPGSPSASASRRSPT